MRIYIDWDEVKDWFENDWFSLLMGWGIWTMLLSLTFIKRPVEDTEKGIIIFLLMLLFAYPAAWLNVRWSRFIRSHEPAMQLSVFCILFVTYVVPYALMPVSVGGSLTIVSWVRLGLLLFAMVISRVGARIVIELIRWKMQS